MDSACSFVAPWPRSCLVVHLLGNQGECGYAGHEEDQVVELGIVSVPEHREPVGIAYGIARVGTFFSLRPGLDKEAA